jgi:hypothetical protein
MHSNNIMLNICCIPPWFYAGDLSSLNNTFRLPDSYYEHYSRQTETEGVVVFIYWSTVSTDSYRQNASVWFLRTVQTLKISLSQIKWIQLTLIMKAGLSGTANDERGNMLQQSLKTQKLEL